LFEHLERVTNDRDVLHISRQKGRTVVVMDEEEYESLMETLHLFSSPANARRLLAAMADADVGKVTEFDPTQ
jgi:antitoxin YefM